MLGTVALTQRHVDDYAAIVGDSRIADLKRLADPLKAVRLLSLSLALFGTWLTDLLSASTPLLQDLGVDADWRVVRPGQEFDAATRALYEALNGASDRWTPEIRQRWDRLSSNTADLIEPRYDVIVVHDPQLLGLAALRKPATNGRRVRWVWRTHLDLSTADQPTWEAMRPYAEQYDLAIFDDRAFLPPGWQPARLALIPPGIDPLGPRNAPLGEETAAMLARKLGIDPDRPLIAQVSPFDEGSDAHGLIEAYDALQRQFPDLQLAIVPTWIRNDQSTRDYFERVAELANKRPGCILLSQGAEIGSAEINAIQSVATLVVQKSLRKGYALWLSEAMWKERPVIAGRTAGTVAQIRDGENGYLVTNTAEFIHRTAALLVDDARRREIGSNGRRYVADRFLITRYLGDTMGMLGKLVGPERSR
ncbi:MAG TPA: glycosyltransferase [Dehalococcoidia bacterium]